MRILSVKNKSPLLAMLAGLKRTAACKHWTKRRQTCTTNMALLPSHGIPPTMPPPVAAANVLRQQKILMRAAHGRARDACGLWHSFTLSCTGFKHRERRTGKMKRVPPRAPGSQMLRPRGSEEARRATRRPRSSSRPLLPLHVPWDTWRRSASRLYERNLRTTRASNHMGTLQSACPSERKLRFWKLASELECIS